MATKPTGNPPGRPPWRPSPEQRAQVEALAGFGTPQAHIARFLRIDEVTLRKHCRDELDLGMSKANAKVAETLFKIATDANRRDAVDAAKFWLSRRAGWNETVRQEHSGPNGGPIVTAQLQGLTDAELEQLHELLAKAEAAGGEAPAGGAEGEG